MNKVMTIKQAVSFLFNQTAYAVYGRGHDCGPYLAGRTITGCKVLTDGQHEEELFYSRETIEANLAVGDIITVYGYNDDDYTIKIV